MFEVSLRRADGGQEIPLPVLRDKVRDAGAMVRRVYLMSNPHRRIGGIRGFRVEEGEIMISVEEVPGFVFDPEEGEWELSPMFRILQSSEREDGVREITDCELLGFGLHAKAGSGVRRCEMGSGSRVVRVGDMRHEGWRRILECSCQVCTDQIVIGVEQMEDMFLDVWKEFSVEQNGRHVPGGIQVLREVGRFLLARNMIDDQGNWPEE